MFSRKICTGIAAAAMSVSALALGVGPASATASVPDNDDTNRAAVNADLIGVGSDTSQHALKLVSDAYNASNPANPIFTYAACAAANNCGTIQLPNTTPDPARPNGSGAGKTLLYGAAPTGAPGNGSDGNSDIDFARSSSAESTAEVAANLQSFPFAVDTLVTAVAGNATNAPASLTAAQLVGIYQCTTTNWSAVGGVSATIAPLLPQNGSGTRTFFLAQLQAANNGVAITIGGCVDQTIQEQDPTAITGNANSVNRIAPFSRGRAGSTLRVEGGFSAQRALYNVVRNRDVGNPGVLAAFGSNGYVCSPAAKQYITAAGFDQLLTPTQGGACGAPTQSATSNFATAQAATNTAVSVTSATTTTATAAKIVATVTSSSAPSGTVSFYEGSTLLATIPLTSGAATRTQPTTAGAHTYRAVFNPAANTAFITSEGTGSGTVSATPAAVTPVKPVKQNDGKAKAKFREAFKPTYVAGKLIKAQVIVGLAGTKTKSTCGVKILLGKKVVGKGKLKSDKATIVLKGLKLGKNKLTLVWGGDKHGKAGNYTFTIVVVKG